MILAKVVGTVVSSHKSQKKEGQILHFLEKFDPMTMILKNYCLKDNFF